MKYSLIHPFIHPFIRPYPSFTCLPSQLDRGRSSQWCSCFRYNHSRRSHRRYPSSTPLWTKLCRATHSTVWFIIIPITIIIYIINRFDPFFADRLVDICNSNHFDGYLINIEIPAVPQNLLRLLSSFLDTLREGLHKQNPDSQLIWYDSIDSRGYLNYQNKLSRENMEWFRNVDGLFTNYWWKPEDLRMSKMMAKQR